MTVPNLPLVLLYAMALPCQAAHCAMFTAYVMRRRVPLCVDWHEWHHCMKPVSILTFLLAGLPA